MQCVWKIELKMNDICRINRWGCISRASFWRPFSKNFSMALCCHLLHNRRWFHILQPLAPIIMLLSPLSQFSCKIQITLSTGGHESVAVSQNTALSSQAQIRTQNQLSRANRKMWARNRIWIEIPEVEKWTKQDTAYPEQNKQVSKTLNGIPFHVENNITSISKQFNNA